VTATHACTAQLGLLAAIFLVASCASPLAATPFAFTSAAPPSLPPATPDLSTPAPAESPSDAQIASALGTAHLAQQLGIPPDQITTMSVEPMQWADTSLGCPQAGIMYIQVITPGYRILLAVGGTTYEYHCDQRQAVFCQNPQPPLP